VQGDEAGQLAEFCVGLRREGYATAGPCVPVVTIAFVSTFAEIDLEADIATDLQAGFGARDIEITSAERVADAYVFHGLWLGSDNGIGSLCAGDCCEGCSGAKKKALNCHEWTPVRNIGLHGPSTETKKAARWRLHSLGISQPNDLLWAILFKKRAPPNVGGAPRY